MSIKRVRFASPNLCLVANVPKSKSKGRFSLFKCLIKKERESRRESVTLEISSPPNEPNAISSNGTERIEIMVLTNNGTEAFPIMREKVEKQLPRIAVYYAPPLDENSEQNDEFQDELFSSLPALPVLPVKDDRWSTITSLNPRKSSMKYNEALPKIDSDYSEDEIVILNFWGRAEEVDYAQDLLIESVMGLAI